MFTDTHAHIYSEEFYNDLNLMLDRALSEGVTEIYMPNIDSTTIERMLSISDDHPSCHPMIGLHPCYVKENYISELRKMEQYLEAHSFCAVGEIGIDLYWDTTFVEEQQKSFNHQIAMSLNAGLPIVIHSRDSLDLTIKSVRDMQNGNLTGIFHCFNGTVEQAQKIIDLGFYLGIGGVITYKNAGVDKIVANLPLTSMVLETDAPYLSPVPHRGKRNECTYIRIIAEKLADLKNCSLEEIASVTTFNAKSIFRSHQK